jgi:hypothetical protein
MAVISERTISEKSFSQTLKIRTGYGDERSDDRLPNVSEDTRARAAALHRDALAHALNSLMNGERW